MKFAGSTNGGCFHDFLTFPDVAPEPAQHQNAAVVHIDVLDVLQTPFVLLLSTCMFDISRWLYVMHLNVIMCAGTRVADWQ